METNSATYCSVPGHLASVTDEKTDEEGKYYVFKQDALVTEAIYIRSPTRLMSYSIENTAQLSWVTISQTEIKMTNITFKGLIQVTARGKITATNCTFIPAQNTSECAVEIFANSQSVFEGCNFKGATKAALLVRDRSSCELKNCNFSENEHSGLLVLDSSTANITNSNFRDSRRFSVYVYRNSTATFNSSAFEEMPGKGVFVLFNGTTKFNDCKFVNCKGGAISIAESSETNVKNCEFKDIRFSAVHGIKNCNVLVEDSHFDNCSGNGVNFEHSNGEVRNCVFENFKFTIFAVFGPTSHPHIHDCTGIKSQTFCAIARDCATPIFENLTFDEGYTHCFSISDFANAAIRGCNIKNFRGSAINVFNGAKATADSNHIENCQYFADVFTKGTVILRNNVLNSPMKIRKRYHGEYTFMTNVIGKKKAVIDGENIIVQPPKHCTKQKEEELAHETDHAPLSFCLCGGFKQDGNELTKEEVSEVTKEEQSDDDANHEEELPELEQEDPVCIDVEDESSLPDFAYSNQAPLIKCIKCNERDATMVCSPCGHRVLCEECSKQEKLCPLCFTTIQKCVPVYPSEVCLICLARPPDTIVLPCGHLNICYPCALMIWNEKRKCPECREKMVSFRHMFPLTDV